MSEASRTKSLGRNKVTRTWLSCWVLFKMVATIVEFRASLVTNFIGTPAFYRKRRLRWVVELSARFLQVSTKRFWFLRVTLSFNRDKKVTINYDPIFSRARDTQKLVLEKFMSTSRKNSLKSLNRLICLNKSFWDLRHLQKCSSKRTLRPIFSATQLYFRLCSPFWTHFLKLINNSSS